MEEGTHVLAPDMGRALLEPIQQPLYSAAMLNNAILPRELLFFGYGIGEAVSGLGDGAVGSASPWHTNMLTGRQLSSPKTFLVEEVSIAWLDIAPPALGAAAKLLDPSAANAFSQSDALDDLLLGWYTGLYRFSIGGLKDYVVVPLPLVPLNSGIDGFSAMEATLVADNLMKSESLRPCGEPFSLQNRPVFIPTLQEFDVRIEWQQVTRVVMLDEHVLFAYLDGRQGREVL